METINGLYKTECIRTTMLHPGAYKTITDVEWATAGRVEWYNHSRLHSSIGMVPPVQYEHSHYAAHEPVGSITSGRNETRTGSGHGCAVVRTSAGSVRETV